VPKSGIPDFGWGDGSQVGCCRPGQLNDSDFGLARNQLAVHPSKRVFDAHLRMTEKEGWASLKNENAGFSGRRWQIGNAS
jgi:hypothetical protein